MTSALVVLISTFVMYILVDASIDPIEDLRASTNPNKEQLIAQRVDELRLDDPVTVRYVDWLKGTVGCAYGQCDLGRDWVKGTPVTEELSGAIAVTVKLV